MAAVIGPGARKPKEPAIIPHSQRRPTEAQFERERIVLGMSYAPVIGHCPVCGWPKADGYLCTYHREES